MANLNNDTKISRKSTGQYASTTVRTVSWLSEPVKNKDINKRRGKRKDIKHIIFKKISDISDENFWKELLLECAYGKFPKGFDYKDGELIYRRGIKLAISPDPAEVLVQTKDFFKIHGGIKSPRDLEIERLEEEQYRQNALTIDSVKWKDIRSLKMRENILMHYVKKLHHDPKHQRILYDKIKNSFTIGTLSNKDVLFQNGEIKTIYGVIYDENKNNYIIDPRREPKKIKKGRSVKNKKILVKNSLVTLSHCYLALWIKFNKSPPKQLNCKYIVTTSKQKDSPFSDGEHIADSPA